MPFPTNMTRSDPQEVQQLIIDKFTGLNISVTASQLEINESPDMLNMLSDDKGSIDGRLGFKTLMTASVGAGAINGFFEYRKSTGNIYIFAHSTNLYKITDIDTEPFATTVIYSSIADNTVRGFNYDDKFYLLDGTKYLVYDGTTVSEVVGFVPTITTNTSITTGGSSDFLQELNYLSAGFKQVYTGDDASDDYYLLYQSLDATEVVAVVDNVTLVEDTDFTVNRTTGVVSFNTAPSSLTASNVTITAYKTISGNADLIKKCTIVDIWTGSEGNRVFFAGNPNHINVDYRSGLQDPTYFPSDGDTEVGSPSNAILGYSTLYSRQIIIKRRSIYTRAMDLNEGDPLFDIARLNGAIGASGKDSIQLLDNFPTFVTDKGVYQVVSVDTQNEQNVRCISTKINANSLGNILAVSGLLELGSLSSYVSIDYDKKYWLFHPTLDYAWVYDYESTSYTYESWFRLDGINPTCILEIDNNLYWGQKAKGQLARFKLPSTENTNADEDTGTTIAIDRYWTSKHLVFGTFTNVKGINAIFTSIRPASRSAVTISTRSDLSSDWKEIKTLYANQFSYTTFSYEDFSYSGSSFSQPKKTKVKENKITYYQIKLSNDESAKSIGILKLAVNYIIQREQK